MDPETPGPLGPKLTPGTVEPRESRDHWTQGLQGPLKLGTQGTWDPGEAEDAGAEKENASDKGKGKGKGKRAANTLAPCTEQRDTKLPRNG